MGGFGGLLSQRAQLLNPSAVGAAATAASYYGASSEAATFTLSYEYVFLPHVQQEKSKRLCDLFDT